MTTLPVKLLLAAVLCGAVPAQSTKPTSKPTWPKLSASEAAKARGWIRRLDVDDEDAIATVEHDLVALGAGVAREVVRELDAKDDESRELAARVLDRVLEPQHAPLLEPLLEQREVHARRYASLRIARFHAKDSEPALRDALEDEDADVAFHAALGLAGLGDLEQLDAVYERCNDDWREIGDVVTEVLAPLRSSEATAWVRKRLMSADDRGKVTCLRLMRSLCTRELAGLIAIHLDSEQAAIKKEAINALRVVVDGDPPIENLSSFDAITMAQKWKERL